MCFSSQGERRVIECFVWVLQLAEWHVLNKWPSQSATSDQIVAAACAPVFLICWLMNDIGFLDVSEWDGMIFHFHCLGRGRSL